MKEEDLVRTFSAVHLEGGSRNVREERVAHEEPLEIQVNGASVAVLMRTPDHDVELGRGFLLTERIVARVDQIESIRHCTTAPDPESEENVLQVRLRSDVQFDLEKHRRHTFASSSCGVCGKATIENACSVAEKLDNDVVVKASALSRMPENLHASQPAFSQTGGLHAAGLFDVVGNLAVSFEDVGRHNAVDKVVGYAAVQFFERSAPVLLVSGRVSFEIVQKAAAARIPVVAGISAPSSLAVRMARALNVTLVGFLRGETMNVYAGDHRIVRG